MKHIREKWQKIFNFIVIDNNAVIPQTIFSPLAVFSFTIYTLLSFGGCSSQPIPVDVPIDSTATFSASGTRELPARWWTSFDDRQLEVFVDSALTANFDLRTAWERLQAARAVWDREASFIIPDISASSQSARNFPRPDFVGGENVQLNLSADYEVDLWGRIRSGIEAERWRANATLADYQASAISLSASITRTWYQLQEARNQIALVNAQIETNQNILELLEARFGGGQVRSVDILRQRQLIESTREQRISVEARAQVLEHQLLVLLGRSPTQSLNYDVSPLPDLPPVPETGIPIELVRRRPDIRSAFMRVQAADKDLAAAISNQYPRLSISASTSLRANELDNVFENWAYSFAGNIFAPIFFGGELSAEVDRNEAVKNQRLFEYGQAVLTAFQEVEDALIQEQQQVERIAVIEDQIDLAQQAYDQLRVEYLNGLSNYLDVLTALNEVQQLRRDLLAANLTLLEFRITLYRALAGSFDTARETEAALEFN